MEVRLYDWERFDRTKTWYISFISFYIFFIFLSLIYQNITWVLLLLLFLGGYLFFSLVSMKKIKAIIKEEWLQLWQKFFSWNDIAWFALEVDEESQRIKNIVFLINNNKLIHTFDDEAENIKSFVMNLSDKAEMLSDYHQTFLDKLVRTLKL